MSDKRSAIGATLGVKDLGSKIPSPRRRAIAVGIAVLAATSVPRVSIAAQQLSTFSTDTSQRDGYWRKFAIGAGISLLAHETAHIVTSMAMGFHPYIGMDHGRPTVFSGIDAQKDPHKQLIFSASGLVTQALIDELILDIPHSRGGTIERGVLAGGIGTTLFYITIGRNGSVSDISYIANTSGMSKTQVSLIFGGINAIQVLRISKDPAYAHFFAAPSEEGMRFGLRF